MKKNRMGKYNPEEVAQIEKEKAEAEELAFVQKAKAMKEKAEADELAFV